MGKDNDSAGIWLRSYDEKNKEIMAVDGHGTIIEGDKADEKNWVRPVIWLSLK